MISSIEQAKIKVVEWVQIHRRTVLYDEESSTLLDVASSKRVSLPWREFKKLEEKVNSETKDPYLVLLFENGNQIALVDPGGVAFPPSETNTGPLGDLPAVVCLKDFQTLKQRIDHYLNDHQNEPPPKEVFSLVMVCIAILDGARLVGFEVGEMEEELNKSLRELEKRSS